MRLLSVMRGALAKIAAAVLGAFVVLALHAATTGSTAAPPPTTFLYSGRLDWAGAPYDGAADFVFSVYGSADANAPAVWSEQWDAVPVTQGRFWATLGSKTQIPPWFSSFTGLTIGVSVRKDGGAFIPLTGRQAFHPAPRASWAQTSDGALTVVGDLTVLAGALDVSGDLEAPTGALIAPEGSTYGGTTRVKGNLTVAGTLTAGGLDVGGATPRFAKWSFTTDDGCVHCGGVGGNERVAMMPVPNFGPAPAHLYTNRSFCWVASHYCWRKPGSAGCNQECECRVYEKPDGEWWFSAPRSDTPVGEPGNQYNWIGGSACTVECIAW